MLEQYTVFTPERLLTGAAVVGAVWGLSRWLSPTTRRVVSDAIHLLAVAVLLCFGGAHVQNQWSLYVVHFSAAVTTAIAWLGQRNGQPPSLSGWLLGPALGLAVLAGTLLQLQITPSSWVPWQPAANALAQSAVVFVCTGMLLGLSALHPAAHQRGISSTLATLSAILVCLGGALSCQLAVLQGTIRNFAVAEQSWALRERLLLAATLIAAGSPFLHRILAPARRQQRRWRPDRLSPLLYLGMVLSVGVVLWQADRLLQPISQQPHPLTTPPVCVGTCDAMVPVAVHGRGREDYPILHGLAEIAVDYQP